MFTNGQLVFAGVFFIAFVAIIFYTYRKDLKLHRKYYRGTFVILIVFLLFVALLFILKGFLKG
ncbi:MAG: hypothetical protein WBL27_09680 [Salinimicrobium sp.]